MQTDTNITHTFFIAANFDRLLSDYFCIFLQSIVCTNFQKEVRQVGSGKCTVDFSFKFYTDLTEIFCNSFIIMKIKDTYLNTKMNQI